CATAQATWGYAMDYW
nr:immunoglobulin heavy chain junction region [Mus musculus]MBK4195651.1 immunoglobulin heavy chain junction region [Mus musculus]